MSNLNRQALVRYHGAEEAARLYAYLDGKGFANPQSLTPENYTFPVVCVDECGTYFGTNTTCMAAAVSCGKKTVSVDEFIARGFGNES